MWTAVVCDTAKVRVFKQITTLIKYGNVTVLLFAILQKYEFSSKSQLSEFQTQFLWVVCDTAKVRVFKQITTDFSFQRIADLLFAILQKYEFSSKSQPKFLAHSTPRCCLRYCKSTSFQANHNRAAAITNNSGVVCDTAKVRVFKQITTLTPLYIYLRMLFAILQKYEFSSKSQRLLSDMWDIFVVCDTAKVRVFKQITTGLFVTISRYTLFAILQKYEFSSKSQQNFSPFKSSSCCLRYCKCTSFKQITTEVLPKMDFGHHCRLTENGDAHGLLHLLWGAGGDVGFLLGVHCFFLDKMFGVLVLFCIFAQAH